MLSTSPAVTTNNTEFSETLKRKHSRSDVTLQDDNPKKILCDWSRGWLNDPVSFKQLGNKPPKTTCSVEDEEQTVDATPGDDLELFDSHEPGFASGGKLTLWQFLLELLLSNKHTNIIRWTEKEGEFILLQAESVAKLWGLRKDRNHRMNYDKLSRALRYYYEKNIIRKVHGHKFVYQFIDLRNLIKFYHGTLCDNVWNSERSISPEGTRISDRLPQTSLEQQNTEAIPIKTEPVIPIIPEPEEPTRNLLRPRDGFSKGRSTIVQQYENSTTFLNPSSPSPTPAYVQPKSYSRCFDSLINGKTEGVSGAETVNLSTLISSINSVLSVGNLLSSIPAYFNQSSNHSVHDINHSVLHNDKSECSHPRTTTPDTLIGPVLPPYPFRCPTTGVSGHVEPDHIARMLKELTRVSTHDATSSPPDSPILDWSRIASGKLHPHRSSSPDCQCSCHTTPPTRNKLGTCVNGWTTDARMRSDLSSDEATSVQLHHQRHEINMKRLSEQISRLNRSSVLNAANETISSVNQSVHSDANEDLTREWDRSSDESMPDRYVWMPVPMAMLTTWFNLLKSSVNPPGCTTDSSQSNCKATSGGRTSSETQ